MAEGAGLGVDRGAAGANQLPEARLYGEINWIGLWTLARREIMRFMKVPAQTVLAPLVTTILFMLVFLLAIGPGRTSAAPTGVSYGAFLAPGLIMMGLLSNAFANSSSSMIGAKMQGNAVDFLMPPLSALELTIAFVGGAAVRGIVVGLASAVIALPFAHVAPVHWWAVLFYGLAGAILFAALGLLGGVWAEKFDQLAVITNFIVTPLTYLSGTFYSINRLPAPIAAVSHFNPVFLIMDGFRYGFIGRTDTDLAFSAPAIGLLAAAMFAACWAMLRSGWRMKA